MQPCSIGTSHALFRAALVLCLLSGFGARVRADLPPQPISNFGELVEHTFRFVPTKGDPQHVFVAGDFNDWVPTATAMQKVDGAYVAVVKLSPDLHHYKFVVDGHWTQDPNADPALQEDDGQGGGNSGVQVGAESGEAPAAHHRFRFEPPAGKHVGSAFVAGDFNQWSPTATPLLPDGKAFAADVSLSPGPHAYKFVIDGKWMTDPIADRTLEQSDGEGGKNSAVMISGNVAIRASDVSFDPNDSTDCDVVSPAELRLSFRVRAGAVSEGQVLYQADQSHWSTATLAKADTRGGSDRFGGVVSLGAGDSHGQTLRYVLQMGNSDAQLYVANGLAYNSAATAEEHAYEVKLEPTFVTPEWTHHAIWYQIFPERFRNGDPANDPAGTLRWTSSWYDNQPGETGDFRHHVFNRRYGGDLQGIEQELPYLRSLGVNAIYLNPIFQAESLHKYDTSDYRHVDEHFGFAGDIEQLHGETGDPATWQWTRSDKLFLDLVAEAHRQGFHVIVDGVFNHVGTHFWAFQDVVRHGKASPYVDWFDITDWTPGTNRLGEHLPFHYKAWDGEDGSLPIFEKDRLAGMAPGPREHVMAIARRWLAPDGDPSRGVDGFRLDAAEQVPHPFWAEFRKVVKQTKPDAYVDGEIWPWAQPYLTGDQFDAVMNYQFAMPTEQFFAYQKKALTAAKYAEDLNLLVYRYPLQASMANQNLLDSHDTTRLASMFVNPDREFSASDQDPRFNPRKPNEAERTRLRQELGVQFTFVGAPMIYYGDEVGMWGGDDPSDRLPMIWKDLGRYDDPNETVDETTFATYQRLIALRSTLPTLQTGFFRSIDVGKADGLLGYARTDATATVYVIVNRSSQTRKVAFEATPTEQDGSGRYVDWLAPGSTHVAAADAQQSNSRPKLVLDENAPAVITHGDRASLSVPAWGVVVLAPAHPG